MRCEDQKDAYPYRALHAMRRNSTNHNRYGPELALPSHVFALPKCLMPSHRDSLSSRHRIMSYESFEHFVSGRWGISEWIDEKSIPRLNV